MDFLVASIFILSINCFNLLSTTEL
jgi:hypothetical protein